MRMRIGPKNTGQFTGCNDSSIRISKQIWPENTAVKFVFEKYFFLFSIWIPISEERKANLRNSYMRMLVRVLESLYSGENTSVSGSTSAYTRSGSVSYSASGSESTISPINFVTLNIFFGLSICKIILNFTICLV
jgi:hypothetical protein